MSYTRTFRAKALMLTPMGVAWRSRRPPSLYELRRAREAGKGRAIAKRRRDSAA